MLLYATLASQKLYFFSEEQSKAEIESWMKKPQNLKGVLNSACSTLSTMLCLSPGKCARYQVEQKNKPCTDVLVAKDSTEDMSAPDGRFPPEGEGWRGVFHHLLLFWENSVSFSAK